MTQMRPVFRLLSLILVSGVVFGLALQPASTAAGPFEDWIALRPVWTSGIIADNAGKAGFVVDDLNQDGITDIATCSNGYAYVLNQISENDYATVWYSEYLGCNSIAAGDANNDGIQELFIGSTAGEIFSFPSDDYSSNAPIVLPVSAAINAIAAADVDADGQIEIVAATTAATYVFDAYTSALEWNASGYGGTQVAIGNIDTTPLPEIVVNSNPGHVLNAAAKIQEWAYAGGFGKEMDIGDVDSDGMEEIAFYTAVYSVYDLHVYNADDQTMALELFDMDNYKDAILVHDVDGDGFAEVLLSDDQSGYINAYRVSDGSRLWQITDRDHGVTNLAVGDANNDGINDVLYGTGMTSSGADYLMIADWRKINPTWVSQDLDPPLYSQAADIDGDGEIEIVILPKSSDSGYSQPILQIYSAQSHQLRGSLKLQTPYSEASSLGIGQLDDDPALEMVVLLDRFSDTRLEVVDGLTLSTQWTSPVLSEDSPRGMLIQNLDAETGQDEIILTSGTKEIWVLNGATNILRWQSGTLDGDILDLAAGDLNGDGLPELAVLTKTSLYVYDTATWVLLYHPLISNGGQVAIASSGLANPGTLLVSSGASTTQTLQARKGSNFSLRWQQTIPSVVLKNILIDDFNQDGSEEFALVGIQNSTTLTNPSLLTVCSLLDPADCLYQMNDRRLGIINNLQVGDLDVDGRNELLINSANLIQIDDLRFPSYVFLPWAIYFIPTPTATPTETPTPTLVPTQADTATETLTSTCCTLTPDGSETAETPTETAAATETATITRTTQPTRTPQPTRTRAPTATPYPDFKPARIYGTVTFGGVPIAGIPLELVFTDGTTQTSVTATLSGEDGSYSFTDIPTLTGGLAYQVIAPNPEDNPDYLDWWETRKLYTAQPDEEVHLGDFDVKDVELLLPENGAQINVPYTFAWQHPEIASSTDRLMFYSADGQTFLVAYTMNPGNGTINSISAPFSVGMVYTWKINPRMADGSQGMSNAYRSVVFNNTNITPTITRLGSNE